MKNYMDINMLFENIFSTFSQIYFDGPIIVEKEGSAREEIMRLIDKWVHSFYVIENIYIKEGERFDKKKQETYTQIGESYCYLNELNSVIAAKVNEYVADKYGCLLKNFDNRLAKIIRSHCLMNLSQDYKDKSEDGGFFEIDFCNEDEMRGIAIRRAVMYFKFFNNLSASRIKYVFFREHPVKSLNYPILGLGKNFADICYNFVGDLGKNKISLRKAESYISEYCLLQELMFSFVYRQDNEFGVFLRFKFEKNKYLEISNKIMLSLQDLNKNSINFKYFFVKVGHIIFNAYTEDGNDSIGMNLGDNFSSINGELDNGENILTQKRDSFTKFYNLFDARKGELYLEPISYQLYDILWKIHGVIDITDKSRDYKVYQKKIQCIKSYIIKFVETYINEGRNMYNNGDVSYLLLYKMGAGIFGQSDYKNKKYYPGIYNIIFKEPDISVVSEKLEKINAIGAGDNIKSIPIKIGNIEGDDNNEVYGDIIKKQKKDENDYKIENLILSLPRITVLQLLYDFKNIVISNINDESNGSYVIGFYKPGVFLAHIVNLFLAVNNRKNIWLFNTRPYVATHPIHKDEKWDGVKNIILIDDSIKTGFTFSLYDSYVKRNAINGRDGMVIKLFALFDYSYYKRLNVISQNNYYSLWKIRRNEINKEDLICDWDYSLNKEDCECLNDIKYIEKDFRAILDAIEDEDKEMDLSFFLTNTDLLLTVCMNFVKEIKERRDADDNNKKIYLYSPTANGYIIMMMCIFILRFVYEEEVGIVSQGIKRDEHNYLAVVDLSFVTGFTIMYNWSIDTGGEYIMKEDNHNEGQENDGVDISQVKNEFDMCAVVYCSCKKCLKKPCTRCGNYIHSLNQKHT